MPIFYETSRVKRYALYYNHAEFFGLPTYRQVFQTGTDLNNSICSSRELAEVENELVEIRDILNN